MWRIGRLGGMMKSGSSHSPINRGEKMNSKDWFIMIAVVTCFIVALLTGVH